MNFLLKIIAGKLVRPFLNHYLRKERTYSYRDLKLTISPGVFHPGFFFSTKFLAAFIDDLELKNKKICEPGAGAGLVSLHALRKGALVTTFDINPASVKNCKENFERNKELFGTEPFFKILQSDLFDEIPVEPFDFIVVNPPYFFEDPTDDPGKAWYAGKEGAYFEKFFGQLGSYLHYGSKVYMILGDNCELGRIKDIALRYNFTFTLSRSKKIWWEMNYIFEIKKSAPPNF